MNNFLAIDASGEKTASYSVRFDPDDKNFSLREIPFADISSRKTVLNRMPSDAIAIFGPKDAATFCEKFSFIRPAAGEPISKTELDSFVSEAAWRIFDRNKLAAVKQLGISGNDLVLADIRIRDFLIDGKSLVSPLDQTGREMEAVTCQTFVRRSHFENIFLSLPENVRLVAAAESGAISVAAIRRANSEAKPFIFAATGKHGTNVYFSDGEKIALNDFFGWGMTELLRVLRDILGVGDECAEELLSLFNAGGFSPKFSRMVEKEISGELAIFAKGVKSAASRLKSKDIYLDGFPENGRIADNKHISGLSPVSGGEEMLKYFGFGVSSNNQIKFPLAAILIEHYFSPKEEEKEVEAAGTPICGLLNYFAKRRMKWMMP